MPSRPSSRARSAGARPACAFIGIDMLAASSGATDTAEGTGARSRRVPHRARSAPLFTAETAAGPLPGGLLDLVIGEGVTPRCRPGPISARPPAFWGKTDPSYLVVAPNQPAHLPPLPGDTGLNRAAPCRRHRCRATDPTAFTSTSPPSACWPFAVGLFIVHSAIGLAFEQRRATVRTLRALGHAAADPADGFCSRTGRSGPGFSGLIGADPRLRHRRRP